MALDNGYPFATHVLPTPTDTPYQTPLRGEFPRQTSRQGSSSPFSDTAPFNPGESYFSDRNSDGTTSLNNPRFSQNLDISFIGEIHSLKKEVERKDIALELAQKETKRQRSAIGELEEAVDALDAQLTQLQAEARARAAKERSLEQRERSIQDDSISALDGMAEERDAAMQRERELRKQLEVERTKKRSLESDLESAFRTQEQERQKQNIEMRKMDRKTHVLESRIKTMVDQFSAAQAHGNQHNGGHHGRRPSIQETWAARGYDNGSVRSDSRADSRMAESRMSMRNNDDVHGDRDAMNSRASARSNFRGSKINGLSLAEELEGEDSDYEDDHEMRDGNIPHSPNALPEEIYSRPVWSRQSRYSEDKARKVMGLPSETSEHAVGDEFSGQHSMGIIMDYMAPSVRNSISQYADAGTQISPPPSPKAPILPQLEKSLPMTPVEQTEEPAATQSRGRVAIPSIFFDQTPSLTHKRNESKKLPMVSSSCQTIDLPSKQPLVDEAGVQTTEPALISVRETTSVSTQTSEGVMPEPVPAANRLSPMDIPVIAIHPPGSRPQSSHNSVVLPPRTKNAGSQVTVDEFKSTTSTSMQTEEIRVDRRPVKVPIKIRTTHTVSSRARSPARPRARSIEERNKITDAVPPRIPRRNLRSPPPVEEEPSSPPVPSITDAYPGNNDNGPLSSQSPTGRRRPIRSESIFAGFDDTHDELIEKENDYSDDDGFASAPPIRKTLSKVQDSWKLVPQSEDDAFESRLDSPIAPVARTLSKVKDSWKLVPASEDSIFDRLGSSTIDPAILNLGNNIEGKAPATKKVQPTTSKTFQTKSSGTSSQSGPSRSIDIRRTTLVSNGTSAHLQRARSPSEPGAASTVVAPPFPVPTRSSSRRIPVSASDGAASPSPYTTSFFSSRRAQDQGKPTKKKILRKVQSAAAVTRTTAPRLPPPAMPLKTSSSAQLQSPKMRRPSNNQFILPFAEEEKPGSTRGSELSNLSRPHAGEASIEAHSQQTTVVDAIAQTMVGEWMWKYVRKRSSFGITEKPEAEFEMGRNGEMGANSGVRHKRWVWLAPYERAVIWSGKQPTSGPALLGKGGRKRKSMPYIPPMTQLTRHPVTIQSVLDVKDDTPMPKGAGLGAAFDRSILILTPQRALKFTAVSRERHYIWLTALSFLSHSTQGMDDLAVPEPISQPVLRQQRPPSQEYMANHRRTQHRDSIHIAKAKPRPTIGSHSLSSPPGEIEQDTLGALGMSFDDVVERPSEDAAEPPVISRVTGHARKRSSTGPRIPVSSFNNYPSNNMAKASSFSLQGGGVRDSYSSRGSIPSTVTSRRGSGPATTQSTMTRSNIPEMAAPQDPLPVSNGFFDAVGTVRMEAFVDRTENKAPELFKAKREHRKKEHKKDMSYWGVPESPGNPPPRWREQDPFRGF